VSTDLAFSIFPPASTIYNLIKEVWQIFLSEPTHSTANTSLAPVRFPLHQNEQKGDPKWDRPSELVEVAGIEPASENLSRKASTCVVRVLDLTDQGSHGQDT